MPGCPPRPHMYICTHTDPAGPPCALPRPLPCPAAAWVASRLGMAPLRRPPPLAAVFTRLLPVSASFAASLFLGNVAYLGLSGDCLLLLAGMLVCV